MSTFKKLALLIIIFLFNSCATHEKTLQFQLRLQKIVTAPELQDELSKCYVNFLKTNPNAEGNVIINYTFLSEIRKEISLTDISPSLNHPSFTSCLIQNAEKIDIRPAYSAVDSDTVYRGTVLGTYSFKKMLTSPTR